MKNKKSEFKLELELLNFSFKNAKLSTRNIFDIPAGKTCRGADRCYAYAQMGKDGTRKVIDGPNMLYRCFAASQEALYPAVYRKRQNNLRLLFKALRGGYATELIEASMNKDLKLTRIHTSGDFFSQNYLTAWLNVARNNPNNIFYCYSKALDYFLDIGLPSNFYLTASYGSKFDNLIDKGYFKRIAYVVNTEAEAEAKGLPVDHDDSHCFKQDGPFALVVHGTQPAGSEASKALAKRRRAKTEFIGYSKRK